MEAGLPLYLPVWYGSASAVIAEVSVDDLFCD